jgi:predicted membrane-bound spermidine synthase
MRPGGHPKISRIWGLGLLIGFVPLGAWIAYRGSSGTGMGLMETAVLQGLSGFLVAGVFAYASLSETIDVRELIAPLYSADLIGGCVGSLLSSLVLIPIVGLVTTSIWMIPVALLAVVLI